MSGLNLTWKGEKQPLITEEMKLLYPEAYWAGFIENDSHDDWGLFLDDQLLVRVPTVFGREIPERYKAFEIAELQFLAGVEQP